MTDVDEFLEHHGVKGQKWGIRHDPAKPAHQFSDEELRHAINRMQMERQYNSLTGNTNLKKLGASFVKDHLGKAVSAVVLLATTELVKSGFKKAKLLK